MRKKPFIAMITVLVFSVIRLAGQEGRPTAVSAVGMDTVPVLENQEKESPGVSLEIQEKTMVKYAPGFEFNDGIYPSFESVRLNTPIPPARLVSDHDMFDRSFYEKVTGEKQIVLYDHNGVKMELETAEIWGYARNGVLYINVANAFHRISFVGSISHFVASITSYNPNYYDPYYYNPYSPYSQSYNRYAAPQSNYSSTDLRQYLLNFNTGEILEYSTESVEVMLMTDPQLYDEFQALRNRKKKQMKFVYIRKFNEKYPLYFPVYETLQ